MKKFVKVIDSNDMIFLLSEEAVAYIECGTKNTLHKVFLTKKNTYVNKEFIFVDQDSFAEIISGFYPNIFKIESDDNKVYFIKRSSIIIAWGNFIRTEEDFFSIKEGVDSLYDFFQALDKDFDEDGRPRIPSTRSW